MDDAAVLCNWIDGLPIVSGKLGWLNASALYEYVKAAILVLYPDISDEPGKHVLAKIDGGP
eukprot:9854249-Ditylum_brightwellii.AAC.1